QRLLGRTAIASKTLLARPDRRRDDRHALPSPRHVVPQSTLSSCRVRSGIFSAPSGAARCRGCTNSWAADRISGSSSSRVSRCRAASTGSQIMTIKTVLVAASGGSATEGATELACRLAAQLGAHVEGYHVQIDPVSVFVALGAGDGIAVSQSYVDA